MAIVATVALAVFASGRPSLGAGLRLAQRDVGGVVVRVIGGAPDRGQARRGRPGPITCPGRWNLATRSGGVHRGGTAGSSLSSSGRDIRCDPGHRTAGSDNCMIIGISCRQRSASSEAGYCQLSGSTALPGAWFGCRERNVQLGSYRSAPPRHLRPHGPAGELHRVIARQDGDLFGPSAMPAVMTDENAPSVAERRCQVAESP